MRVALVVPAFPRLSETFVVRKFVGLVDRGLDVHVVCQSSDQSDWDLYGSDHPVQGLRDRVHVSPPSERSLKAALRAPKVIPHLLSQPATCISYLRRSDASVSRKLRDLYLDSTLIGLNPDAIHFEFGHLAVGRIHLGRLLNSHVTASFRGLDISYIGLDDPTYYDELWSSLGAVHVLGGALWQRALDRGAPAHLVYRIIPPAVDVQSIAYTEPRPGILGTPARPLRILSVGRLHWTKAYDDALEAVRQLGRREVVVEHRIAGGGELFEAVAFWRHSLGLDSVVDLLGPVPPSGIGAHLAWADVFMHAAISEGFCNAVLEAQAAGLPIVTTDADGLPENVEHGVSGLVVPRRRPEALADALTHFASDPEARHSAGMAGRTRAKDLFGIDAHLDSWMEFFRELDS